MSGWVAIRSRSFYLPAKILHGRRKIVNPPRRVTSTAGTTIVLEYRADGRTYTQHIVRFKHTVHYTYERCNRGLDR